MRKHKIRNSIKKMSTGRKLLLGLAALLLLAGALAGGAYLYITLPDARVYRELDEDFGHEFFEIFLLDLETAPDLLPSDPGGEEEGETPAPGDPAENNTAPAESAPDSASTLDRRHDTAEKSAPTGPETARRSKEEIIHHYSSKIRTLENIALARLEQLRETALAEYRAQKASGQVDKAQLARKYMQAAERLEKNVDLKFQETLDEMEKVLRDNQHPTGIIAQIKRSYQQEKAETRRRYFEIYWR